MIKPGYHVYVGPDRGWRYAAPQDRFVRIAGASDLLRAVQRIAHTGSSGVTTGAGVDHGQVDDVLVAFGDQGLLAPDASHAIEPARTGPVHVSGDNPIAEAVSQLLGPDPRISSGAVDEDVVRRSAVVVSSAGWLPDTEWRRIDEWCRRYETAWHMTYLEGTDVVVGPMYVPGRTASYADTRGRRLAASGVADELRAFWSYLDGPDPKPPVPWPSPAGAAVIAGLVAGDVRAYLRAEPVPSVGHQLVVDLGGARIDRHPVLQLP